VKAEPGGSVEKSGLESVQQETRTCPVCGTKFFAMDEREFCAVCMLRRAFAAESAVPGESGSVTASPAAGTGEADGRSQVRRFENYEVTLDADGSPIELGRGAMGVTYKALDVDLRCPVAVKVISERYLGDESARLRFLREARAAASVRHANVASVFHLGRTGHNYFYAMEFVHGETLENLIRRSGRLEIELALEITTQVAAGLVAVHNQKLVHRDIKPSNIMVSLEEGRASIVKIIDLGLAKSAAEAHSETAISTPGAFVGTPEFASPEQFAGLSVDIRSDLYSLGATLWQMVTGHTPFQGTSAELMYRHLHAPLAIGELDHVPQPVIVLIEVLLEKDPSQRFQNPAELVRAITTIIEAINAGQTITRQTLQEMRGDLSRVVTNRSQLYGRDVEREVLLTAFDRVVASGIPELVLVSGYSGIGKSSIVNELHKVIVMPRGIFISGKFDQHKREIPYATLAQAFQGLVREILSKSKGEVDHWRDAICEAVGTNGLLLVNLIPELKLVVGEQPPVPEIPAQDAQNRFQLVLRRFLGAFAQSEHPLALFLDDLQWLDVATLELLEQLMTEPDVRYLLLIGAYRDNEVSPSHPLMRTLDVIRKAGANMREIALAPLAVEDVGRLVADSLGCEQDSARPLAELVHEKTAGNPFFAIQFLMTLAEEKLLVFDSGAAAWSWDLARIRAKGYTENVADLMAGKLSRLSHATQEAL
jgi:serine/threonine protein kinase